MDHLLTGLFVGAAYLFGNSDGKKEKQMEIESTIVRLSLEHQSREIERLKSELEYMRRGQIT